MSAAHSRCSRSTAERALRPGTRRRRRLVRDRAGEKFALVGESGSGKSITALSVLRLVDARRRRGAIRFEARTCSQERSARCAACAATTSR
jgi:ABC-type lipoprotein export system ATPase subunit